jgi:serine phosphatase RsbU (regulator of sigma subunit)
LINTFFHNRFSIFSYSKIYLSASLFFICFCIQISLYSQSGNEVGYYPVYNFSSKTYNAQEQNWAIAEDNRGLMYFANSAGVLEYDGISWRLIKLSDKRARSLATGKLGRVYVGSENEMGYLAPNSIGEMSYVSLMPFIPEKFADFQVVWNVFTRGDEVYFQTDNYIFVWDGKAIRIISSKVRIHSFFLLDNEFYARLDGVGLTRLEGDSCRLIPKGESFAKRSVYGMIRLDSSTFLIASESRFFKLKHSSKNEEDWTLNSFTTHADKYLEKYGIFNTVLFETDKISIGTWGGGSVVINLKGELEYIVDKNYGLQDQIIQQQYLDEKGNMWLALSKGISRIEVQAPISLFNNQNGLQGTIQSITRFNNRIYAATNVGVSYLYYQAKGLNGDLGMEAVFKPIDKLSLECWDLLTFKYNHKEILLVVTNEDISMITENNQVISIMNGVIYDAYQSHLDPARVYVGHENGLSSLYYQNGDWIKEKQISGIDAAISNITEDFLGNIWMGTLDQGVLKMNIKSFLDKRIDKVEVFKFDTLQGIPTGTTLVSQISERLIIGTSNGIYKFKPLQGRFEPDSSFGIEFADGSHYIHRISEINDKEIWMTTVVEKSKSKYQIGFLKSDPGNKYTWITQPFIRVSESIQHAIYLDESNIVWIGGPDGLYRYDAQVEKNYNSDYYTLIRRVTLANGDTIFKGTGYNEMGYASNVQPAKLIPVLPYSLNSMSFDFAAQSGENESGLTFSYMLEGYDKKWSEGTSQSSKEYTNLNEGQYVMRIKARNLYGHEGIEAVYSFTILSPWYRTPLAYIGYIIFLAVFIFGIVKVYTRNLRAIIRERTAEVVRQKDEIEEKNKEITDSIHYASKIQSAILPPTDYAESILSDFFILYMPRDIVSGDFYWLNNEKNRLITVAADCTGHGVPGAFMSMLGVAFLNEIVRKNDQTRADEILNQLRTSIIKSLRQTGKEGENKDGMDIALCVYDLENMKLQFSGANNPLFLIRNEELIVFKADKMPIGIHSRAEEAFTLHEIDLIKGDIFYTFSDGYVDQFGGPEGKKFLSKQFREFLLTIHKEEMKKQEQLLKEKILDWMKKTFQVDDIMVMGIKI